MSDQLIAYCFLGLVCVGWPAFWVFVAVNVTRYGLVGWYRRIVERAKASLPPERGSFSDA